MPLHGWLAFAAAVMVLALWQGHGYRRLTAAQRAQVSKDGLWHLTAADIPGSRVWLDPRRCHTMARLVRADAITAPRRAVYLFASLPSGAQRAYNLAPEAVTLWWVPPDEVPPVLYRRWWDRSLATTEPVRAHRFRWATGS